MKTFLDRIVDLPPKRLALLAARLQSRVEDLEAERRQPIAVVGMACRFPGGADTPEKYWDLLLDGRDAVTEVPPERWDVEALFDPDPDAPGKTSTRHGAFLEDVDRFDADLFGIAPREAERLDPQQRLLLELAWEALERAGRSPDRAGRSTGVFVGISGYDYFQLINRGGLQQLNAYTASGTAHSMAAGRLSYVLGLQGPSFPIDTACSSSLVAVHQACASLRSGECETALAGGINLILSPEVTIALSKSRMMAPDGHCKVFDARADGFVRGEGGAILVLRRLADALENGEPIQAVIRGSAVNQDGRSNGITAPNGPSQEAVIRLALAAGGVSPGSVTYVEAHGTGTSLGDPIEVQALAAALRRGSSRRLAVGSAKANVGHLESAAGMAGLVKLILAVRHGELPPQIHLDQPNPHIPWADLPIDVPRRRTPWTSSDGERIGGVSSFGFSGTNAHVIVSGSPEQASAGPEKPERSAGRPAHVITVSGHTPIAAREYAARMVGPMRDPDLDPQDVAYTVNTGRARLSHRIVVVGSDRRTLAEGLEGAARGEPAPGVDSAEAPARRRPRVAFLFTGQGSQRVGTGRELYEVDARFRDVVDRCAAVTEGGLEPGLLDVMFGRIPEAEALLVETRYTQPALYALEAGLLELWRGWGVEPGLVLGHSVGEYVAAYAAGVFGLEEGMRLVAERGRVMEAHGGRGAMVSVRRPEAEVREVVGDRHGVWVSGVNGPESTVISGEREAVEAVAGELEARGAKVKALAVSHAFHSGLMEEAATRFAAVASGVEHAEPGVGLVTNVTGELAKPGELGAEYWGRQIREAVQFQRGMETLWREGARVMVELGPSPTLLGMGAECVDGGTWVPSLRAGKGEWEQLAESMGELHLRGVEVDWEGWDRGHARRKVVLPTYPFQRQRYWLEDVPPPSARGNASLDGPGPDSTVPEPLVSGHGEGIRDLVYHLSWADRRSESRGAASALRSLSGETVDALRDEARSLAAQNGLESYDAMLPELDRLAGRHVASVLGELGAPVEPGSRWTLDGLIRGCGILSRHDRLTRALLQMMEDDGILEPLDSETWTVVRPLPDRPPERAWEALALEHPSLAFEVDFVHRCLGGLGSVLVGDADPLEVLFPAGGMADAERLYSEIPLARTYNTLMGRVVAEWVRAAEDDRTVRLLEIGGGTGGTTAEILSALEGRRFSYHFTDVSPAFLGPARGKFGEDESRHYGVLDVTRDPTEQGFEEGSFDLLVAANVVHATPRIRETLANARRLLRPGGAIVLYEAVKQQRFSDLTVGMTEGWWSFDDVDLRPNYALMDPSRWRRALLEVGFEEVRTVPGEEAEGILSGQSVVMARRPVDGAEMRSEGRRTWVLVTDEGDALEPAFCRALEARGQHVVRLARESFVPPAGSVGGAPDGPHALAEALESSECERPVVVYLPAAVPPLIDTTEAPQVLELERQVVGGLLGLVQALVGVGGKAPPRLVVVSRGAQVVGPEAGPPSPVHAALWGLGQTIELEHPELETVLADLDPRAGAQLAEALALELAGTRPEENQIALRGGGDRDTRLLGRRLVRGLTDPPEESSLRFREDGSYLVTGGLRGLGPVVARWLAERGAGALILMGRSDPSPEIREAIAEIERLGTRVFVRRGDVTREEDVERALAPVGGELPELRGVVHLAGVLDDGVLVQQDWPRFARVMSTKVNGAWILHRATLGKPLDHFVLFSSGVGLVGATGQGNHAAANAFLDGFAHYRRSRGLPAVSINWGAWADIGAAAERVVGSTGEVMTFSVQQGLAALEWIMSRSSDSNDPDPARDQVAVLAVDWHALSRAGGGKLAPLYREIAASRVEPPEGDRRDPRGDTRPTLVRELDATLPARRRAVLASRVREHAAEVLGLSDPNSLDPRRALQEFGLDSLMAVELRNRLGLEVGRVLPATLIFEYPSVLRLSEYLADHVLALEAARSSSSDARDSGSPEPEPPPPDGLDDLSTDDVAAELMKQLQDIEANTSGRGRGSNNDGSDST